MFAQESGMDLQKEREAFEKECRLLCYKGNMVMSNLGSFYNNEQTNWMWQMWLSAKAQAVPKGYVLASKEPSADLVNHGHQVFLGHFNEGGQTGGRSLYFAYKAMIEAQEPTND